MRKTRRREFISSQPPLLAGQPLFAPGPPPVFGAADPEFVELPDGFRIERQQHPAVTVRMAGPWLLVIRDGKQRKRIDLFCSARQLARSIAIAVLGAAESPPSLDPTRLVAATWTLAPRILEQRDRLLRNAGLPLLAAQRLVAMTGEVVSAAQTDVLYRDPYIARDVVNYTAAVIALAYLESEFWEHFCARHLGKHADPSPELRLRAMRNWRGLYSPTGVPYRSLNRTLMNLPAGMPPALLCNLNRIRLERPVLDRLELTALLMHAAREGPHGNPTAFARQRRILHHATAAQIRNAMARIAAATNRALSPRRCGDVLAAINYIADCPIAYRGTLAGLVQRAVRWHRETAAELHMNEIAAAAGGGEKPTARPPIPLPATPGITFLATVGAVFEEGRRMHNCIASYARAAVAGDCFLFHIDRGAEMASVEVKPDGAVWQAAGPGNCNNFAASWGREQLQVWASALPLCRQLAGSNRSGRRLRQIQYGLARRLRRRRPIDPNQLAFPFYAGLVA